MTTLSQIAAELYEKHPSVYTEAMAERMTATTIKALIDTPWNLPHSSGAMEEAAKSVIKKYVLEEDDGQN